MNGIKDATILRSARRVSSVIWVAESPRRVESGDRMAVLCVEDGLLGCLITVSLVYLGCRQQDLRCVGQQFQALNGV
ncbi:hypothetical protein [uncultured Chloroflexus sp.]|uniref:hypothetical protein n=1 Tax=uncultured Chloroflexus sp. TaxID=214040 RepID=UPI00261F535F|nr:hypothetical protein [uncultured Chloroflexus sp.]